MAALGETVKKTTGDINKCADKSQLLNGKGECVSPIVKCPAFSTLKLEVKDGYVEGALKVCYFYK